MLSIIITMGFEGQQNLELPELGDEFDHMKPLVNSTAPIELVVVDRAWPRRWDRLERAVGGGAIRLKYVPPKPSQPVALGYRSVNVMRNSGAIVSSGEIVAFVDDFLLLDGKSADEVWGAWEKHRFVLCPVFRRHMYPPEEHEDEFQIFSGHNPGIYMCTREQFLDLGGFNENFDGSYGEADTEWQNRLDRLLDRDERYSLRRRKKGVLWRKTHHANGDCPQSLSYPWQHKHPKVRTNTNNLRCNRSFFQKIATPRIERGALHMGVPLSSDELDRLREGPCVPDCEVCNREDREEQIASYTEWGADLDVEWRMRSYNDEMEGSFDPWGRAADGA